MPNWSANRITLYEDYQLESDNFYNDKDGNYNIKAIFEKFLKDTEEVVEKDGEKRTVQNLMNIMPTPDILTKVHASSPPYLVRDRETGEFVKQSLGSPELGDTKEEREAFYDTNTHPKFEQVVIEEGTDIYNELVEKYGFVSWYDWNVSNWGTKWNTGVEDIELDEYQLKFWCHTAWCPPNELLQFIADKYKVTVECFYEIEGYGDDGVGKDTFSPNLKEAKI